MEKKERICSLCNLKFFGYGNNPEPLNPFEARCCDDCNARFVIPARIEQIARKRHADRIADHIDGYDRDDLGESPDY